MEQHGDTDDRDAGVDVCGVTDDVTGHDARTDTDVIEESMEVEDEGAETDAKMFGLIPGLGKREDKSSIMPTVNQDEDDYDMTHKYRGYALLINNERFSSKMREMGLGNRSGSDVDEANLSKQLNDLGFRVITIRNKKAQAMKEACYDMAAKDHTKNDCFMCVILSHGDEGVVYGIDGEIEIKELVKPFKGDVCSTLVGKPKLFIIQACRGYQTDPGVGVDVIDAKGKAPSDMDVQEEAHVIKLPIQADFLFAYSTVPGYYSWRNGMNGSWFIQALCKTLNEYGKKLEFAKILTLVNKKVAQDFQSNNPDNQDFHRMKQIPCITSMLTKDVYFNTKKDRKPAP